MGIRQNRIGKSYEYRVRNFFRGRPGWSEDDTFRVPLSGACTLLDKRVGKYDIVATYMDKILRLEIECKKTGKTCLTLQRQWFDKIDYSETEFLVFAFSRTKHYCIFPTDIVDNTKIQVSKKAKGRTTFKISKQDLETDHFKFEWVPFEQVFYILPLEEYIIHLEKSIMEK